MYDYSGHTDCNAPLGVVVHQSGGDPVRLPIIDDGLQLYERKVGPTSITRRAEVTVPIEGADGTDWLQYVTAFETPLSGDSEALVAGPRTSSGIPTENAAPDAGRIQTADIIGQPIDTDGELFGEPSVLFRGYIGAVGSQEGANRARFRIFDPMKFLSRIDAGVSFRDVTSTDVLRYVRDRYVEEQSVFTDVSVDTDGVTDRVIRDEFQRFETARRLINGEKIIGEVITFSSNRDTLVDVLSWLQERTEARVWFQPSGERGITLTAIADDAASYNLTPESESLPRVIKNNALYELRPLTSLRVKGNTGVTISLGDRKVNTPFGDTYPEATASYPPLIERFGGELTQTTTATVTDTDDAEQTAKTLLKQAIDAVSGGSILTTLAPMVRPFDTLTATPACSGVTTDVEPLQYEVQEATHSVVPNDSNLPRTELSVSMAVDPSLIETESTVKDSRTGDSPTDSDPFEQYQFGPGSP